MALDFQKVVEMLRGPLPGKKFPRLIVEVRFTARFMGITLVCLRPANGVDLATICPISHGSSRICGTVDLLEGCRGMQLDPPKLLVAQLLDRFQGAATVGWLRAFTGYGQVIQREAQLFLAGRAEDANQRAGLTAQNRQGEPMRTRRTMSFLSALFLAGASSLALAQHGGHGGGGGFGHAGHDTSIEDLQKKMKLQATEEQRAQLRTCLELADRLRMLADDLTKRANLSGTEFGKLHQRWSQLLRQRMQSDHEALLGSLTSDQQAALKDRLRKMDKVWSELALRYEATDRDVAETPPDAKRLAGHAKDLEKSLKKWQKQHRELGSEMGVEG
jgi:hypothetical protein